MSCCHVKLSYVNHNDEWGLAKIIAFSYGVNTVGGGGKCSTSNYLTTFFYVTLAYIRVSSKGQVSYFY